MKRRCFSPETLVRLEKSRIHDWRHLFLFAAGARASNSLLVRDAAGHANVSQSSDYIPAYSDPVRDLVDVTAAALAGEAGD